ncbi:MAG: hypothetical protein IJW72_06405 [Alphaproteobacteria bacterium]|nr:hypothetical protein [Alphaproteobacteria bacterium]MBQ7285863.1 hypothetical protein [Alphaproteobacteria bacterium]
MSKIDSKQYCLNDLTLINFTNIGTPQQGMVISRIINNWDNRRYLKSSSKLFHSFEHNAPSNGHLWWKTKI